MFSETDPSSSVYPLGSGVGSGSQVENCPIEETLVSGDEVMFLEKTMDAAALPWYLSNELLVVLSLVIVGCGVYFFFRGGDDDSGSGSSGSGLSVFRGLVDLLRVINEEEREEEERRHNRWDLNAVNRFAAFNPGSGESGLRALLREFTVISYRKEGEA